jgi:molybdenum cofactor biosynthesis enzyme MoaA
MALSTYTNIAKSVVNNKVNRIDLPSMVTFIVTWRCNLRCFMCDVWKKTDHDDMTPEEAGAIFKQFPKLDTLRLTGGEPFLRRDFDALVGNILENVDPTVVHLTTAGVMYERIVNFARTFGSKKLHIGIDTTRFAAIEGFTINRSERSERLLNYASSTAFISE